MRILNHFVGSALVSSACYGFCHPAASFHRSETSLSSTTSDSASFEDLGLSPKILTAVRSHSDWKTPTAIQQLAIPQLVKTESETVWCEAPTGAGKTVAYALPLLHNRLGKRTKGGKIASLILCPTRELAAQIGRVVSDLASNVSSTKKWNIVTLHGGVRRELQFSELASCVRRVQPIDVVVATPGRLVDVLTHYSGNEHASDEALEQRLLSAMDASGKAEGSLSLDLIEKLQLDREDDEGRESLPFMLDELENLVLDEADRLLGRAFESEMDAVLDLLPPRVPTWLFSATYPKQIEPRVNAVLDRIGGGSSAPSPIRISCTNSDRVAADSDVVSASLSKKLRSKVKKNIERVGPASTINLRTIRLEKRDRTQALRLILEQQPDMDRVLVFVATRYAAEHVSRKLRRAGIRSSELHGKLNQDVRVRRLEDLRKGKIRVLLSTDVASRGLDIVGLPVVVNYDLPRSTADFVHRVGRTGRAGKRGIAITFCTPDNEAHLELIEKRHLPEPVAGETLPGFEPDEEKWRIEAEGSRLIVPGAIPSGKGLAHDRMFGGVKGRRKSKKDKLREKAAAKAAEAGNEGAA